MKSFSEIIDQFKDYPHIQVKVRSMWGSGRCREYILDLIMPARHGRAGFPFHVTDAAYDLLALHDHVYPEFAPKGDIWSTNQSKYIP